MTDSSTRISRSEVVDLCEMIYRLGPLPVCGERTLGLFLCVRLTLRVLFMWGFTSLFCRVRVW